MGRQSSEIRQPFKAASEPELPSVVFWEVFVMLFTHFRMDLRAAVNACAKQTNHTARRKIPAASNFLYYSTLKMHVEIMLQYSQSKEKKYIFPNEKQFLINYLNCRCI